LSGPSPADGKVSRHAAQLACCLGDRLANATNAHGGTEGRMSEGISTAYFSTNIGIARNRDSLVEAILVENSMLNDLKSLPDDPLSLKGW